MTKVVAIVIPTCNQAPFLKRAVLSALHQEHHECEVLVSDDQSDDETPLLMQELLKQCGARLRYVRQEKRLGISSNCNFLFANTKAPFVVRLDSDDALRPHFVEQLLSDLLDHPAAAYAHCSVQEIDNAASPVRIRSLMRRQCFQNAGASLVSSLRGYKVSANICMFRAEAILAVEGYDERLAFAEDWDLAIRLALAGWGNCYNPNVLAEYRVWDSVTRDRSQRKLDEVSGIQHIFDVALKSSGPALNTKIHQARKRIALGHLPGVFAFCRHDPRRRIYLDKLRSLGRSRLLSIVIKCEDIGAFWLFYMAHRAKNVAKSFLKARVNAMFPTGKRGILRISNNQKTSNKGRS